MERGVIESSPVQYDELPSSLIQPSNRNVEQIPTAIDVQVPMLLPTVPISRVANGRFNRAILTQQEHDLFTATWKAWTNDHPEYAQPMFRNHLFTICFEQVVMFRLQLMGMVSSPHLAKMYHAAFNRQQRAREGIGATRRITLGL